MIFSSIVLGIAYCAPPGIITAETIRRGLGKGFLPAFMVQAGSLVGDTTWALIAITGAAFLVQNVIALTVLSVLGIILLFKLAWDSLQDARSGRVPSAGELDTSRGDFATGAVLSLTNPYAIAFWAGVGGSVLLAATPDPQWYHFGIFLASFLVGAVAWCFFLAGLVAWGRQWVKPGFFYWVNLTCAFFLTLFGLQLLIKIVLEFI